MAYESEYFTIVFEIEKFCQYLEHCEFQLKTDNQALSWILTRPHQLAKLS